MTDELVTYKVIAPQEDRLDKFIADRLKEQSRARIQALIKNGHVTLNENVVIKTGVRLTMGDVVSVRIPQVEPVNLIPESIGLDVIFENPDLAIINKPAGMVVHPAPGHSHGTLVHAALDRFKDLKGIGGEMRPGIVHRLDKDTSGLIIIAKNDQAHRWLQDQFKTRRVEKTYLALVDGIPPTPTGRVEASIARDSAQRKKMAVVSEGRGRTAITDYKTIEKFRTHTLLEAHPLTGRTHQIRLHMAFLGCPVAGDKVYGRKKPTLELGRHFLHASRIRICLPGDNLMQEFLAPLP